MRLLHLGVDKKNDAYSVKGLTINQATTEERKDTFTFTTHITQLESKWNSFPLCLFLPFAFLFADNVFLQTPKERKGKGKAGLLSRSALTLMSHKKESY